MLNITLLSFWRAPSAPQAATTFRVERRLRASPRGAFAAARPSQRTPLSGLDMFHLSGLSNQREAARFARRLPESPNGLLVRESTFG